MLELVQQRNEINRELNTALSLLGTRGREVAETKRVYRMRVCQEVLSERAKGTPSTIMSDIVRGHEEISELKMKWDIAEAMYKSAQEAINIKKIQLRIVEGDIEAVRSGK